MKKFYIGFAILLIIMMTSFLYAGPIISGKITTTNSTPVSHAKISFVNVADTNRRFFSLSDSLGNYAVTITRVGIKIEEISDVQLFQNYPNPFSERTTITYSIKQQVPVEVSIYNILGQRVKTFRQEFTGQNIGQVQWDGRDGLGKKVANGIYFYAISVGDKRQVRKMLFIDNITLSGVGNIPFNKNIYNYVENIYKDSSNVYTVYIENIDSTKPKIEPVKIENNTIQGDTVLNFQVEEATTWELLGLEEETIIAIATHPYDERIIYAGSSYDFSAGHMGKLFKSTNSGKTWDTLIVGQPLFSFLDIVIDPIHPETIYTIPLPVLKSTNGGKTWFDISNGIRINWETRVGSIALDPNNTNILYAGTGGFFGGRFYKSTNGGESWRDLARGDTLTEGVGSIAIDPNNSNTVYAGTAMNGRLWKTTDGGETWILTGLGETSQMIYDILIHPTNPKIIFAGISEIGIWKSEDAGNIWIQYNEGLIDSLKSAVKITIRKTNSELLLVNASRNYIDAGIFKRTSDNEPWVKIGINSIRDYAYCDLRLSINENIIYFGGSRGLYYIKLK